ncbi:hypothetical protein [[Clostridium] scindens]|uniref:hypothetical protein n=1 Tax=Clostridium scindens (strain JCM 10418 / VPI 12708) TaxID=29347 RepID=UPI001FC8845B|nr:hypothetical protein [[Clostridium] scindens]
MKKRLVAAVLALTMSLPLAACAGADKKETKSDKEIKEMSFDELKEEYLMHPEFFEDGLVKLQVSEEDLHTGYLRQEEPANCVVNLPKIGADKAFRNNIYNTWMHVVFE